MKLVDGPAMRRMDRRAVRQYGIREIVLMENAGRGVADVAARYIRGSNRRISILAGKGAAPNKSGRKACRISVGL